MQVPQVAEVRERLRRVLDCDLEGRRGSEVVGYEGVVKAGAVPVALVRREDEKLGDAGAGEAFGCGGEVVVAVDGRVADEAVFGALGLLVEEEDFPALVCPLVIIKFDVGATFDVEEDENLEVGEEGSAAGVVNGGLPDFVGFFEVGGGGEEGSGGGEGRLFLG